MVLWINPEIRNQSDGEDTSASKKKEEKQKKAELSVQKETSPV